MITKFQTVHNKSVNQLDQWKYTKVVTDNRKTKSVYRFRLQPTDNGTNSECSYTEHWNHEKPPELRISISRPDCFGRSELDQINEFQKEIGKVHLALLRAPGFPQFFIEEGILETIDIYYDHKVNDLVEDYINAMSHLKYPFRKTAFRRNNDVAYVEFDVKTTFLNLYRLSGVSESSGILRQLKSFQNTESIARAMNLEKPTLLDVTPEWITSELQRDIEKLGISEFPMCDQTQVMNMLMNTYPSGVESTLWELLLAYQTMTKDQVAIELNIHPSEVGHMLKAINATGCALAFSEGIELPPLKVQLKTCEEEVQNLEVIVKKIRTAPERRLFYPSYGY